MEGVRLKICAENVRRNRYKYGAKRRICTGKWKLYGNNPEELYGIRGISSCEETEKKLSFESPGRTKTARWNT